MTKKERSAHEAHQKQAARRRFRDTFGGFCSVTLSNDQILRIMKIVDERGRK